MTEIPPAVLKVLDKFAQEIDERDWKPYTDALVEIRGGAYKRDIEKLATLAFEAGREFGRKQAEPQEPKQKGRHGREREVAQPA